MSSYSIDKVIIIPYILYMHLNVVTLGLVPYGEALTIQDRLVERRINDEISDTILLLEHPPVVTTGRREQGHNILVDLEGLGIELYKTSRGGEVTYHGPGQLVGYPIQKIDTRKHKFLLRHLESMEEVFISYLKSSHNIVADRIPEHRGVWVEDNKITAVGISLHRKVTKHGFAYNINTNLEHFSWIVPCGIGDKGVTSLSQLLKTEVSVESEIPKVAEAFAKVYGYTSVTYPSIEELL